MWKTVALTAVLFAAVVSLGQRSWRSSVPYERTLPLVGADYTSSPLPLATSERLAVLEGYAARRYVVTGEHRFVLTVVDATQNPHAIHSPRVCLGGRGWQTTGSDEIATVSGQVRELSLKKGDEQRRITHWFVTGGRRYTSFTHFRLGHMIRRLTPSSWYPDEVVFVAVAVEGSEGLPPQVFDRCSIFRDI